MCEITGYSSEELVRMTIHDLTHPDDQAEDRKLLDAYLHGNVSTYENEKRYVRKDGNIRWSLSPLGCNGYGGPEDSQRCRDSGRDRT